MLDRRRFLGMLCPCAIAAAPRGVFAAIADIPSQGLPQALELGVEPMTRLSSTVWVARIAQGLWLHTTTWPVSRGFYYPANGLIMERPGGALMIDTTWSPDQADVLLDWSRRTLSAPISSAVATHFHLDRTGGIPALKRRGVSVLALPLTCQLARAHHLPVPAPIPGLATGPQKFGPDCELYFPGGGHTRDNIVAWLPRQRTLFGGGLVRSITSISLGDASDAAVSSWADSIRNVQARYPRPRMVVPAFGTIAGDPIAHTLTLLARSGAVRPPP
ncbi:MAG: MBL fold metallo-hydrolase [Caulobacteraceae bacterium]